MGEKGHRPVRRSLSVAEAALVRWLIAHGTPNAQKYIGQVEMAEVVSECTCGCPSIDLAVPGVSSEVPAGSLIISDMVGASPEGVPINVILWVRDDTLSELEIYSTDDSGSFSLPEPGGLRRWEDAAV